MVFSAPIQGVKLQGRRSPNAQTRRPVGKPFTTESDPVSVLVLLSFPAFGSQWGESTSSGC